MKMYWQTEDRRLLVAEVDDDCHPQGIGIGAPCIQPGCHNLISKIDMEAWTACCEPRHSLPVTGEKWSRRHKYELPFKFAIADADGMLHVHTPGTQTSYRGMSPTG